ncbi:hypothetical protein MHBO_000649 [Bonamia ostreae]|uniref:Methylenetetrahydrofolate reductase (NAD(P)H) n=1 Tax=Bonamia ostreae TaxID=126728 RepID=A0ABV2AGJ3_9EUKA
MKVTFNLLCKHPNLLLPEIWRFNKHKNFIFSLSRNSYLSEDIKHIKETFEHGYNPIFLVNYTDYTKNDKNHLCNTLKKNNIKNLMLLPDFNPKKDITNDIDYSKTIDFMKILKEKFTRSQIYTLAFSENEISVENQMARIKQLKEMQSLGLKGIYTRPFFDTNLFFEWRERALDAGIKIPITAGMITLSQRNTEFLKTKYGINQLNLSEILNYYKDKTGIMALEKNLNELRKNGINDICVYTLYSTKLAESLIKELNL